MLIFRGLAMVALNGQTKGPLPPEFTQVGAGYLPQIFIHIGSTKIEMLALTAGILLSVVIIMMEIRSRQNKETGICFAGFDEYGIQAHRHHRHHQFLWRGWPCTWACRWFS